MSNSFYEKLKYSITAMCLAFLIFFMLITVIRMFTKNILMDKMGIDNSFTKAVMSDAIPKIETELSEAAEAKQIAKDSINWEALYPFKTEVKRPYTKEKTFFNDIKDKVFEVEKAIEKFTTDYVAGYDKMTELSNKYDDVVLGWGISEADGYNNVVTLSDGYLTGFYRKEDVTVPAEGIISLKDFTDNMGIKLLYVQAPFKVCENDTDISGVLDYSNQNADALLKKLKEEGINSFDIRKKMPTDPHLFHEMFYITDHHWKTETGLWTAGLLSEYINESFEFGIDESLYNPEKYQFERYEKWFLGSLGKKVTLSRAEPEDISLIYPRFSTNLTIEIPSRSINKTGDFNVMYRKRYIETKDLYNGKPYTAYFYGDNALTKVTNNNNPNGKRILMVSDSFDNCVSPFLALGVSELDSIDRREFNGSLKTYISENDYDIIIIMYSAGMMYNDNLWFFD